MSACEKSGQWQTALHLRPQDGDVVSFSAAISAVGQSHLWPAAVELLDGMLQRQVKPNSVICTAASSACKGQWQKAFWLRSMTKSGPRERSSPLCELAWRLAQPGARPRSQEISRLVEQARQPLALRSDELSVLVWSFASLSVDDAAVTDRILSAVEQLGFRNFRTSDLARLSWSLTSLRRASTMLEDLQKEFLHRLRREGVDADSAVSALTLLWSGSFAGWLPKWRALEMEGSLAQFGRSCDQTARARTPAASLAPVAAAGEGAGRKEPHLVLSLADLAVVQKPPEWQVDDGEDSEPNEHQRGLLSAYLQALFPRCRKLFTNLGRSRGFLHRLDVPSSGLILVAKSHEAWYRLKVQAACGGIRRDYIALCHGWMSAGRQEISARVHWWPDGRRGPSHVRKSGRLAKTMLKVTELRRSTARGFSLVNIRILTGRMHQIRLHTAHVGHPTVRDGKYTPNATFEEDASWCPDHFLHRYSLAFVDMSKRQHEVFEPLPKSLKEVLRQLGHAGRINAAQVIPPGT